jgi:hypothetical protein
MAQTILWQRDCPGFIETQLVSGVIQVTCWVEEEEPPPPPPATGRVTDGLQMLYNFREGSGAVVHDRSGVGLPLDLFIENESRVRWETNGSLAVNTATTISSIGPASKLRAAVQTTNAVTVEAWIKPANITQDGPARILTISYDYLERNLLLGQSAASYDMRLRTTATTLNGEPWLSTPAGAAKVALTHVVYTRASGGATRIYINNAVAASGSLGGNLSNWDANYRLALANELIGGRPWLGEFHLVAFYGRALSATEVDQNYRAGSAGA